MTVIIDNYDSFTYNIYQIVSRLTAGAPDEQTRVVRNDQVTLTDLEALGPDRIIVSPGPGRPEDAGISVEAIRTFAGRARILGVCLGHQCIAQAFGAKIVQARRIVHGKVEEIALDGRGIFRNLPSHARFTRYHSLAVDEATVPEDFEVSGRSEDGEIMALRHREYPIEGVQFHPESIGSDLGARLIQSFLNWRREPLDRRAALSRVVAGRDLTYEEASIFMDDLTDGALDPPFIAAMLATLAAKGPTADEVAGCASVLVAKRLPVDLADRGGGVVDTCGTGGDGMHTFNISSFSALLAAACGARVAKHGNRSVSSKSGSTDFYEKLGIATDLDPPAVARSLSETRFAYMAAPLFHGAMRHAGPVRRALGIKTIMNCLGPLANPAGADYQVIGVFDDALLPVIARAARRLGVRRVWTVRSTDGLDEISSAAPSRIFSIDEEDREKETLLDPADLGITGHSVADLVGGTAEENAAIARDLLAGGGPAAIRDAVALNAGAALAVSGIAVDLKEGYRDACAALDDGRARAIVETLVARGSAGE